MEKSKKLIIYGNGEIADLAQFYFTNDSDYEVCAFIVDDEFHASEKHNDLPLMQISSVLESYPPNKYEMFVALSYAKLNATRKAKYNLAKEMGYTLASYVCTKSVTWNDLSIGENCFILENQTIQPTVKIGNNVMIWSGNHLGHGCIIADHTYIASHAVISGHAKIGECCFIGVNATIRDFAVVGDECFITMDSSVSSDLQSGSVILTAKNTIYENESKHARVIKKKYFNL